MRYRSKRPRTDESSARRFSSYFSSWHRDSELYLIVLVVPTVPSTVRNRNARLFHTAISRVVRRGHSDCVPTSITVISVSRGLQQNCEGVVSCRIQNDLSMGLDQMILVVYRKLGTARVHTGT